MARSGSEARPIDIRDETKERPQVTVALRLRQVEAPGSLSG